ncbi:MAG TPA: PPOX class F420-dependent oxidoreductase [Jatrophihabitantaceae bacterium]|jgi:PPOX class probable F420-dependent enzyme|nr:PPOX class F420-dependent oxidoreductase [Jatrophihabitantaceae bacterium]
MDRLELLESTTHGMLTTLRRDGRPQTSVVAHTFDSGTGIIRISVTDGRAKTRNLRRDHRASYCVTTPDLSSYLVADVDAELLPVTTDPHDATADELVEVYRAISGEHPDWDEYRSAMVADRRLVLRLSVLHTYGWLR